MRLARSSRRWRNCGNFCNTTINIPPQLMNDIMTLLKKRFVYCYFPIVVYFAIYIPFFSVYKRINYEIPNIYSNWGYLIGFVFLIARTCRFFLVSSKNSRVNYLRFLSLKTITYDVIVSVAFWLVFFNFLGFASIITGGLIDYIFLIQFISLFICKVFLGKYLYNKPSLVGGGLI